MSVRPILLWPDPRLTQVCDPFVSGDPALAGLIEDLFDSMYAANGRGLAAPQIGVLRRVFVVDVSWKEATPDPRVFINPRLVQGGDTDICTMEEQCLSIPGVPMPVDRPQSVQLQWETPDWQPKGLSFDGVLARCVQHELDHLNGRVIFDHQPPERRATLEAQYAG
ncbi:MAG: peptide deformylase [Roseicyclus sp.]|nr:peptide deformylase [Roseicyclus sp.]